MKSFRNYLGRRGLEMLCGRLEKLGGRGRAALARLIAALLWTCQRQRRALMLELMRQTVGQDWPARRLRRLRREAYLHMGRTAVEFLRLRSLRAAQVRELVRLEGAEQLRAALAAGRGVLILTGHIGNWELLGARIAQECAPGDFHVIAQPQRDQRLTRLLDSVRAAHGVKVISRGSAAREVLQVLRAGGVVGILMDVDMKEQGIFVDFMGRPASTATGPAAFALHTGAVVLPSFATRQPDGSHVGLILPPVEITRHGDYDRDLRENTARFSAIIEAQVRAHPEQWIWLPNRWRSSPPAKC